MRPRGFRTPSRGYRPGCCHSEDYRLGVVNSYMIVVLGVMSLGMLRTERGQWVVRRALENCYQSVGDVAASG